MQWSYYVSRSIFALLFGIAFLMFGIPWWGAGSLVLIMIAVWFYLPESGRYVVRPENGARALRRDQRQQAITNVAGRNGFVAMMFTTLGMFLYIQLTETSTLPPSFLGGLVGIGFIVYYLSEFFQRR